MHIYQARPLFTAEKVRWHKDFKQLLADAVYNVQWPGEIFSQQEIDAWGGNALIGRSDTVTPRVIRRWHQN